MFAFLQVGMKYHIMPGKELLDKSEMALELKLPGVLRKKEKVFPVFGWERSNIVLVFTCLLSTCFKHA